MRRRRARPSWSACRSAACSPVASRLIIPSAPGPRSWRAWRGSVSASGNGRHCSRPCASRSSTRLGHRHSCSDPVTFALPAGSSFSPLIHLLAMTVAEITPTEFVARRERGESLTLLDVREEWELGVASVPDVVHIPMGEVADRLGELERGREVVVLCRSGRRSLQVANFLQQNGFQAVNLAGGILAWSRELDATIPTY